MNEHSNRVELLGYYGGDKEHALSAWTSTSRALTQEKRERIPALLKKLATDGHHTPFEKSSLHFLVTTDVATHIHLLKHRVGVSVNAESARYKELRDDKFYVPADWPEDAQAMLAEHARKSLDLYHRLVDQISSDLTTRALEARGPLNIPHGPVYAEARKRAKESARFVLPYANQITSDVMFNFRSFMHFQGLRNHAHAQVEVRDVARSMLKLVFEIGAFDASLEAFGYEYDTLGKP